MTKILFLIKNVACTKLVNSKFNFINYIFLCVIYQFEILKIKIIIITK